MGITQRSQSITVDCKDKSVDALPVYDLVGTPYEMGFHLGAVDRVNIQRILSHHVDLATWAGGTLVDPVSLTVDSQIFWGLDGLAELRGMADGAEVPLENLMYHNLQMYAVGACSHFAGRFRCSGRFVHGANIDVPVSLLLKDSMRYHVQRRFPNGGVPSVVPGMAGFLGSIGGVNKAGLFVSSSMLLDAPQPKRLDGTLHSVILTRLLDNCRTLEEAARFLSVVNGWGGWAVAVSVPKEGRVVYAEYQGKQTKFSALKDIFICSNHVRLFSVGNIPDHSRYRLERLEKLLKPDEKTGIFLGTTEPDTVLFDRFNPTKGTETRFRTMSTIFRGDHVVSLMADSTGSCRFALTRDAEHGRFTSEIDLDAFSVTTK